MSERFTRWQAYTISQLTFAINLFTGLAVAALGFALTYVRDNSFSPSRCFAAVFMIGLALLAVSILSGVGATITRLLDFRETASIARRRERPTADGQDIHAGSGAKFLGKATWRFFWLLLASFVFGIASIASSLFSVFGQEFLQRTGL